MSLGRFWSAGRPNFSRYIRQIVSRSLAAGRSIMNTPSNRSVRANSGGNRLMSFDVPTKYTSVVWSLRYVSSVPNNRLDTPESPWLLTPLMLFPARRRTARRVPWRRRFAAPAWMFCFDLTYQRTQKASDIEHQSRPASLVAEAFVTQLICRNPAARVEAHRVDECRCDRGRLRRTRDRRQNGFRASSPPRSLNFSHP